MVASAHEQASRGRRFSRPRAPQVTAVSWSALF